MYATTLVYSPMLTSLTFVPQQMRKLETKIRKKEQLAEGLHLIDFEQLKIENQSLNEKIEERNEELLKLRKKTTATVQVLTHIKEKLQFVEKENQVCIHQLPSLPVASCQTPGPCTEVGLDLWCSLQTLAQKLGGVEKELVEKRDKLQRVKTERDKLRLETTRLKETSSYVSKDILLEDVVVSPPLMLTQPHRNTHPPLDILLRMPNCCSCNVSARYHSARRSIRRIFFNSLQTSRQCIRP